MAAKRGRTSGAVTFKTRGADEIARILRSAPLMLQAKHIPRILQAGADVIAAAAKTNISVNDTGLLRESIGTKRSRPRNKRMQVIIGPRSGPEWTMVNAKSGKVVQRPVRYAHLIEFGTKAHTVTRTGFRKDGTVFYIETRHPGTQARPFMRPAFDQSKGLVMQTIQSKTVWAIENTMRRRSKGKS